MNADDFPFEEILVKSNSEEELIDNIRDNIRGICSKDNAPRNKKWPEDEY